jgi:hypothetical protein
MSDMWSLQTLMMLVPMMTGQFILKRISGTISIGTNISKTRT